MTIFLDLAIVSERWLRHQGRLAKNTTKSEKVLVVLSLGCALMGTVSLILLTIFDTQNHSRLHRLFLLLYLLGFVLSAVFICAEYQRLGIHFRQFRVLRMSFWIKLAFIIVEVGLAIGFGVCLGTDQFEVGAVLEWVIAFIFTFYILVFLIDLLPATRQKHHRHRPTELTDAEMDAAGASTEPLPMATANARLQDQANGPYGADQHSLRTEQPGRYGTPVDGARPSAARNF
ncbi:MAG: hypothetical protein M1823_002323 [Watsoniomyces obsoletus]|nr:MAG: hypothetical protein M1823_002323 [Watsoniomyces obsoletus]